MTIQDKAKAAIPLLQAVAEGKTMQNYNPVGWEDCEPTLECVVARPDLWRVKPEPREWWVTKRDCCWLEIVKQGRPNAIHVREVL